MRQPDTLRERLTRMPPLDPKGLRDCQIAAIEGLEASFIEDRPRALIQLATGAGKTFTACSFSYRLIRWAGAKRALFLVDRNNLGDQTLREFQGFQPPGAPNRFTDTHIVQHLRSHRIDPDAKVVITTMMSTNHCSSASRYRLNGKAHRSCSRQATGNPAPRDP